MNLNKGKAQIEQSGNNFKIKIPSKKNWFVLLFGTAWLGPWYFVFKSKIQRLGILEGDSTFGIDGFETSWLIAWTLGGLFILGLLLWGYFGKEQIGISNSQIDFSKTIFGIGTKKELSQNEVKNFRFNEINESWFGMNRWAMYGLGPGKVKFDCGLKTYSFGLALDDAEANYLVEMLNNRIKK